MSGVIDTNILLYAVNVSAAEHKAAKSFLSSCGSQAGLWFLTEGICYEFLRVATHPRVFPSPMKACEAMRFLDVLLKSRRFDVLTAGNGHWVCLRRLLDRKPQPSGNIFFDIRTVALMHEHAVRKIYTADTDFLQFADIDVVNPLG
ncbi:MAG: PIN domain-containing protein [Kiritimatiellae bacterium]|nr:PIN domain-containing protein [Kiritimatiellia bacterium]